MSLSHGYTGGCCRHIRTIAHTQKKEPERLPVQARLDGILAAFEGTHCHHNFTIRVAPEDACANRYILSFRCAGTMQLQVLAPATWAVVLLHRCDLLK